MRVVSQKSEWFIFAGFTIMIFTVFTDRYLPKGATKIIDWLGLSILAMSLIVIGIRTQRQRLHFIKPILFLVAGLGISAFTLTTSYTAMTLDFSIAKPHPDILKRNMESHNYDLKAKSKVSRMYASMKYRYEGQIVDYLSETGQQMRYQPTRDEVEFRDNEKRFNETMKTIQTLARRNFYCWLAMTVCSVFAGFFTPIRRSNHEGST